MSEPLTAGSVALLNITTKKPGPKILSEFPPSARRCLDWSQFLDGQIWELQRGRDFEVEISSARACLYMACRRKFGRDFLVRTCTTNIDTLGRETIAVQLVQRVKK